MDEFDMQEHTEPELQIEEDPLSDIQPEEHTTVEFNEETSPKPAPRTVSLRVDLLVTLVAGLLVGMVIGYVGRPLLAPEPQRAAQPQVESVADASTPTSPTAAAASSADNSSAQSLMDSMVAQTRHLRGNPDAPVTIIEFSDFQ
ncbi:MAG: hypothetical protein ACE5HA_15810 [Anaerolineae bacterium]